jgi:hypothetical protein
MLGSHPNLRRQEKIAFAEQEHLGVMEYPGVSRPAAARHRAANSPHLFLRGPNAYSEGIMKQSDLTTVPAQMARPSGPGPSSGKPSQQPATALESAQTVSVQAARKKAVQPFARDDMPEQLPAAVSVGLAAPDSANDSLIGRPNPSTERATDTNISIAGCAEPLSARAASPCASDGARVDCPNPGPLRPAPAADKNRPSVLQVGPDNNRQETAADMHYAVTFEHQGRNHQSVVDKPRRHRRRLNQGSEIRDASLASEVADETETLTTSEARAAEHLVPGIGDRVPYLAMVAGAASPLLRSPELAKMNQVKAPKPKSRAQCQRRCGRNGFCDPSSELGCGGVYCGRKHDDV